MEIVWSSDRRVWTPASIRGSSWWKCRPSSAYSRTPLACPKWGGDASSCAPRSTILRHSWGCASAASWHSVDWSSRRRPRGRCGAWWESPGSNAWPCYLARNHILVQDIDSQRQRLWAYCRAYLPLCARFLAGFSCTREAWHILLLLGRHDLCLPFVHLGRPENVLNDECCISTLHSPIKSLSR